MRRLLLTALLGAGFLAPPMDVRANWDLTSEPLPGGGERRVMAQVRNPSGHVLRIYRNPDNIVRATLRLNPGLDRFSRGSCGTMQIDAYRPVSVFELDDLCIVEHDMLDFRLGVIEDSRLVSAPMVQLLYGVRVAFRYRLEHGGYEETDFTLKSSNFAISSVVGDGVEIRDR